jgi:16S rRNA (uracil1498-N3)-methyltransferase
MSDGMAASVIPIMQGSIRLFVAHPLAAGQTVPATSGQAHYLGGVMRRAAGDFVTLFNGRDGEWSARIDGLRKDRATFIPTGQLRPQQTEPELWLAFAPLKRDATDLVAQKATELGATRLLPVLTARTNAARVNTARLLAIATEAAEQCERLALPDIAEPVPLAELLAGWPGRSDPPPPLFAAAERAAAPHLAMVGGREGAAAALLVGPEGGFTPGELDALAARDFVRIVSLGPRILRAETAAIVGLALLQAPTLG